MGSRRDVNIRIAAARVIKQERRVLGLSQQRLADRIGMAVSTLGHIERLDTESTDIFLGTCAKIAEGLDLSLTDFIERVEAELEDDT